MQPVHARQRLRRCSGERRRAGRAGGFRHAVSPRRRNDAGPANAAAPAPGNTLWGIAEAEDEASHRGIDFIAFNRSGRTLTALAIRPDEGP